MTTTNRQGMPMPREEVFLQAVREELERARSKFPGNEHQANAMSEEAGETVKALLEHEFEGGEAEAIYREAVQTAAMALRVATEGDSTFSYDPAGLAVHQGLTPDPELVSLPDPEQGPRETPVHETSDLCPTWYNHQCHCNVDTLRGLQEQIREFCQDIQILSEERDQALADREVFTRPLHRLQEQIRGHCQDIQDLSKERNQALAERDTLVRPAAHLLALVDQATPRRGYPARIAQGAERLRTALQAIGEPPAFPSGRNEYQSHHTPGGDPRS